MKKEKQGSNGFRTHIPEPKWQVIVSVVVAVALIVAEAIIVLKLF